MTKTRITFQLFPPSRPLLPKQIHTNQTHSFWIIDCPPHTPFFLANHLYPILQFHIMIYPTQEGPEGNIWTRINTIIWHHIFTITVISAHTPYGYDSRFTSNQSGGRAPSSSSYIRSSQPVSDRLALTPSGSPASTATPLHLAGSSSATQTCGLYGSFHACLAERMEERFERLDSLLFLDA